MIIAVSKMIFPHRKFQRRVFQLVLISYLHLFVHRVDGNTKRVTDFVVGAVTKEFETRKQKKITSCYL
jgi:hypothetical protein